MRILWQVCQKCDFAQVERVPRRFWMRVLPSMRHYHCAQCNRNFLAPLGLVETRQWMNSTVKNFEPAGEPKPE